MSVSDLPVLPVGMQDFVELRGMNAVYVDKTQQLCHLIKRAPKFSFIGRPRRFGKSIMLSTLRELFLGKRQLFAGTWAYDNYDFTSYPVLYIDFAKIDTDSKLFTQEFLDYLRHLADSLGIALRSTQSPANIFGQLIEGLAHDKPVVVLIDEYDRPLIDHINDGDLDNISKLIRNFYVQLKANSRLIHKCVMTGITEFGKLSIFSGANQFTNVSFDEAYMTLFGYTRAELETNFAPHIEHAQHVSGNDPDEWWKELKYWYNGYSWNLSNAEDEHTRVYCPFTVTHYLRSPTGFINYWAQSGTSSLLVEIMKTGKIDTLDLDNRQASIDQITSLNPANINAPGLLFQTGYLTLTGTLPLNPRARLVGYPNKEIITTLNQLLLAHAATDTAIADTVTELVTSVRSENWTETFTIINRIMAGISYEIFHRHEHYAHAIIHTILSASDLDVISQYQTNTGRIDILINYTTADDTPKQAIIELKTSTNTGTTDDDLTKDHQLAQTALDQIHTNNYTAPFTNPVPIGIVINTTCKQITAWIVE